MTVEFTLQGANGQTGVVDANYVSAQLQEAGYNPQGMSADGMTMTLVDDQGPYEVKTSEALKNLGWTVSSALPVNADYDNVQMGWRAAITKLPDDDSRRAYIEGQMKRLGHEAPSVVGSGRDWYAFNPQSNQYVALTNNPSWDTSDLVEGGLEGTRMVGSALGGGAGVLSGGGTPASIAMGAAGAGLGGAAVDAAQIAMLSGYDPEFRHQAEENIGAIRGDMAGRAALDSVTTGGLGALAKYGGKAAGLAQFSPFSRAAESTGAGMQMAGKGVAGLAGGLDNSIGRDVTTLGLPVVGDIGALGFIGQAPEAAVKGIAKGMGNVGRSGFMQKHAPNVGEWLANQSASIRRVYGAGSGRGASEEAQAAAEQAAHLMGGGMPAREMAGDSAQNILGNVGRKVGERFDKWRGGAIGQEATLGRRAQNVRAGQTGRKVGQSIGRGVEYVGDVGRTMEKGAQTVASGVLKGARAGGQATHAGGTALRAAGTLGKPLETRNALRYGAEEAFGADFEEWNPLRRRQRQSMMDLDLAQN